MVVFGLKILRDFEGLLYPVCIVVNPAYIYRVGSKGIGVVGIGGSMGVDW